MIVTSVPEARRTHARARMKPGGTRMVTGGAKRILAAKGYKFEMAIPSTIVGKDHTIYHKTNGPVVVVPFHMDGGSFFLEVCFEEANHH